MMRAVLTVLAVCALSDVYVTSELVSIVTMPLSAVPMPGDRVKRSLATICLEMKPNGPLEDPYYMCRGRDLTSFFNSVGNVAPTHSGGQKPAQQITTNFGHNNYNDAVYGGANSHEATVYGHSNKFATANDAAHLAVSGRTPAVTSNHFQSVPLAEGSTRIFPEQMPTRVFLPKPSGQNQQHFTGEHQTYFQPIVHQQHSEHQNQQQVHHQLFHHSSQQHPTLEQPSSHHTNQFFRWETKKESKAPNEKLNGHGSIYSDSGSRTATTNQAGFIPPASYSTQYSAGLGIHSAAPTYQNGAASTGSGISSYDSHINQRFGATQFGMHGAADCGEDCGKSITQTTPSSKLAQNGVIQHGIKSTIHNGGYASQLTPNSFAQSQLTPNSFAQSVSSHISNGNDANSASNPSVDFSASTFANAPTTTSFRLGDNAAFAFATHDGSSVPNLGPNDTPSFGPNFLGLAHTAALYPSEALYSDDISNTKNGHQIDMNQNNNNFHPFHSQTQHTHTQTASVTERYRSMIDEEVLQMPNWAFSADELDLYRSTSTEKEDVKQKVLTMPLMTQAPLRVIPLEHLEDPVMHTFYSSLDDVGPLPLITPTCVSNFKRQPAHVRPPPRQMQSQSSVQSCLHSQASQYCHFNPWCPQPKYSVQPIFIALPCYGRSLYPSLGNPIPAELRGITSTQLGSPHQAAPSILQSEVRTENANLGSRSFASKDEDAAIVGSINNLQNDAMQKFTTSSTLTATTVENSNESGESEKVATPINNKANAEAVTGLAELKPASSEQPTTIKIEPEVQNATKTPAATTSPLIASIGASTTASTPTTTDSADGKMFSEMSTSFRSLILNARKLAQMMTTSQEEDDAKFKEESSTLKPSPKKIRHVLNGKVSSGNIRQS